MITEKNHLGGTRLPFILEVPDSNHDRLNTYPDRFCSSRHILHHLLSERYAELKMCKIITFPSLIRGYETYMFEKRILRRVFRGKRKMNSHNKDLYKC